VQYPAITSNQMSQQTTHALLMVRPSQFRSNEQTAQDNYFQHQDVDGSSHLLEMAQKEFDNFVTLLREHEVHVVVVQADQEKDIPDAHFPNNWISTHPDRRIAIYPMKAPNRREERSDSVLEAIEAAGFFIEEVYDYSEAALDGIFLEGTGSMVLDHAHQKAYAALSQRTDEDLLIEFCEDFEYTPVVFTASQTVGGQLIPIYHTNVMLCVGSQVAVICSSSIKNSKERKNVLQHLKSDGLQIIDITEAQMHQFAGNMLEVRGTHGPLMVMSQSALRSLTPNQVRIIEESCVIVAPDLTTIETYGGGSARCMLAEIFLPQSMRIA
jgi:hypothetical protein